MVPASRLLMLAAAALLGADAAFAIELGQPIDCDLGATCFVQKYVDVDPGPGWSDFACGSATDDGHTGTDIRVASLEAAKAGVEVRAAAPGIVLKTRDGVADRLVETEADRAAAMPIGLGNVVILGHEGGYQTIYAHMRKGSLRVRQGDRVEAGSPLGLVGVSGLTGFAHVHFEVRKGAAVIDPFTGEGAGTAACRAEAASQPVAGLWAEAVRARLRYADATILSAGFAGSPPSLDDLERGGEAVTAPAPAALALVFYVHAIHMRNGDRLRFSVSGPGGFAVVSEGKPLGRYKATYLEFAGKRRTADRWPPGTYSGKVELLRAGAPIASRSAEIAIP